MRSRFVVGMACLIVSMVAAAADPPRPLQVLVINSFSRENSPYEVVVSQFRLELSQRVPVPVAFFDTSLDGAHFDPERDSSAFVRFLRDRFEGQPPDLVVPFGPVATLFYTQNRTRLFPDVPMLIAIVDGRLLKGVALAPTDAASLLSFDIPRIFANILQLLPNTTTIAIVIGDSRSERFWIDELREGSKPLSNRVSFIYLNKLALADTEKRVAALPPNSAVLFLQIYVDAAGVSQQNDLALARVNAATNAPVFGIYGSQFGKGIVGGPLMSERKAAARTAEIARAVLAGETNMQRYPAPLEFDSPVYDWRELQRWRIPEDRLPQGSTMLFRQPSVWERYGFLIAAVTTALLLQSFVLVALLFQRSRRRQAEEEALRLSGRILTAHEDERRRLARELHDDVTPRLARLAIEAARTSGGGAKARGSEELSMHDELVRLSEDVHAFSYRLHPTVLDDLGLVDALRAECDRTAHGQGIRVDFLVTDVPDGVARDVALCLFRIAQEALRNIVRHARAQTVKVSLALLGGDLRLTVSDDGGGFEVAGRGERHGLGHASMRERARQVGGDVRIDSVPGTGTTVAVSVPLAGNAS